VLTERFEPPEFCYWRLADAMGGPQEVRFRGQSGHQMEPSGSLLMTLGGHQVCLAVNGRTSQLLAREK
jgi:hypothetical protein